MKTNWIKIVLMLIPFAFLTGCKEKEPVKTPGPVITKIVAADNVDEEITEAALNQSGKRGVHVRAAFGGMEDHFRRKHIGLPYACVS